METPAQKLKRKARDAEKVQVAKIARVALICVLGAECETCHERDLDKLEVDHPKGRGYSARGLNSFQRIARYWQEFCKGVDLRVLCRSCNASDGAKRGQAWWQEAPF